jgi:endonuclease G, mitochondrial
MLNLSKEDRRALREALTSGFRSYSALKLFVSDHFTVSLNEIASSTATKVAADDLIEHFEEGSIDGDVSNLILKLYQERPRNPEVQKLIKRLQGFLQTRLILDPSIAESSSIPFELPSLYDDKELESFLPQRLSYEADVGKLRRGLQLADAVCKISFTDRSTTGTGVLIAPDLVLTNYHVLSKPVIERSLLDEKVKTLQFEFGFLSKEHDIPPQPDCFAIAATDPLLSYSPPDQLDYALLRVDSTIKNCDYIQPVPIQATTPALEPKTGLIVLQHPEGNVMQISLSASGIVQVDESQRRVWYVNRTQGGSSGGPCFNSDWELVALHHASMSRGFGSIREGILFPSILAKISDFLV